MAPFKRVPALLGGVPGAVPTESGTRQADHRITQQAAVVSAGVGVPWKGPNWKPEAPRWHGCEFSLECGSWPTNTSDGTLCVGHMRTVGLALGTILASLTGG